VRPQNWKAKIIDILKCISWVANILINIYRYRCIYKYICIFSIYTYIFDICIQIDSHVACADLLAYFWGAEKFNVATLQIRTETKRDKRLYIVEYNTIFLAFANIWTAHRLWRGRNSKWKWWKFTSEKLTKKRLAKCRYCIVETVDTFSIDAHISVITKKYFPPPLPTAVPCIHPSNSFHYLLALCWIY